MAAKSPISPQWQPNLQHVIACRSHERTSLLPPPIRVYLTAQAYPLVMFYLTAHNGVEGKVVPRARLWPVGPINTADELAVHRPMDGLLTVRLASSSTCSRRQDEGAAFKTHS